jgi:hypothetical protein
MAIKARIYRPAKSAMQSGRARSREWRIEFDTADARFVEPLMGWTGAAGTLGEVALSFPDKEAAIAFAERYGLDYEVEEPQAPRFQRKNYADNFSFRRMR